MPLPHLQPVKKTAIGFREVRNERSALEEALEECALHLRPGKVVFRMSLSYLQPFKEKKTCLTEKYTKFLL
jgi:hypothetical protein